MKNCISVADLRVSYHRQVVLENVTVDVPDGKMTGVIGPNGSGKTTFLKAILELIPIEGGEIQFFDTDLSDVRNRVAYVPQRESVDWDFPASVYDVVAMGRLNPKKWWQRVGAADKEIIQHALKQVAMEDFQHRQIGQLSGGQQQRVFLARALAQQADLICMDEPFVGVDMASQEAILNVLHALRDEGKSIVMVHHDLSMVADNFDYVLLMNRGLEVAGATADVIRPEVLAKAYGSTLFFQS